MQCEAPDTRFYAEIRDMNLEFLGLVAAGRARCHGPVFGLDSAVVDQLVRLNPVQLEAIATTPCLLAAFATARSRGGAAWIAESPPIGDAQWADQTRLFGAGLLTYIWQMSRRDSLRAALCAGPAAATLVGALSFREIRGHADLALQRLEARFRRPTRFWPDLIRATRDGHEERMHLARLTAIQLATSEAGQSPWPVPWNPAPRALAIVDNLRRC